MRITKSFNATHLHGFKNSVRPKTYFVAKGMVAPSQKTIGVVG
jgi:hypothetical protein